MWKHVLDALAPHIQNQFLSGGIVLMMTAALLALCRRIPIQIGRWFQRRFTITVDVSSDDPLFGWLSLWLAVHPYSARARQLTATSERDEHGRSSPEPASSEISLPQVLFTPAPGNHLLLYQRRLVWLSRDRKEAAPGANDSFMSLWKREVFTLRLIGRNQDVARRLLEDARSLALSRRHRKVEIFIAGYDYWQSIDERDPRPLSSVFLPEGKSEEVVKDVERFLASQAKYIERGIPWRRGYLFYGIHGSGKTSLICALAGHFKMNLYILNLASSHMSDDNLMALLARVPLRSFLLLEDVDSAFIKRDKSDGVGNKLTFSGLLNALDGAGSKDGTIAFMTTNHIEKLDEALIRPGRADKRVEFGYATAEQAVGIFRAFFPDAAQAEAFGELVTTRPMTMADVQQHLVLHERSPVEALAALPVLKEAVAVGAIT